MSQITVKRPKNCPSNVEQDGFSAISRGKLTESILRYDRVCSRHFVSGKPAASWDQYNVDWVPTLNLGHSKKQRDDERQLCDSESAERVKSRRKPTT